jgi:diguanylate cyclase (GGDEF)-like protein
MHWSYRPTDLRVMGLAGAALVALTGIAIVAAAYPLGLNAFDRDACFVAGAVLVGLAGMLSRVRWERTSRRTLLVPPGIVLSALGILGALVATNTQPLLAFLLLSIVYLGLTQRPGMTAMLMPVILVDWWLAFASHPPLVLMRLPFVIVVALLVGEGTAWRQRRYTSELASLWATSLTDPLTNVGNRRALARELVLLPESGLVIFLDLDHFKQFNDRYGHAAGDTVLAQFAGVLAATTRSGDVVARFGGEEFVVLVNGAADGPVMYERIREAWHSAGAAVTFSAGIAQRRDGEPPTATLSRADVALYDAKLNGRDRYELADLLEPDAALVEEIEEVAFDDDEFTVAHLLNKINQRHASESFDAGVVVEPVD